MFRKITIIIGLLFIVVACAGLAACKPSNVFDKYDVLVYYDSNGGSYMDRQGVTVIDGFRFDDCERDANGNYHVQLVEMKRKNDDRPQVNGDDITLTKADSFLAGWYLTRTAAEGNGSAYEYDDRWDFDNDELIFNPETGDYYHNGDKIGTSENGKVEIRLYAGWVDYFLFDYYVQKDGEWVSYEQTPFDYSSVNATNKLDTIFTPYWDEGVMNHTTGSYTFPKADNNSTFVAAYSDISCEEQYRISPVGNERVEGEEVTGFTHSGSLDLAHAKAVNPVQNIYVVVEEGVRFRISEAAQLAKSGNARLDGHYEILSNLDFSKSNWPTVFSSGTFTGSFVAQSQVTLSGAKAVFSSASAKYGGLFGAIGEGAVIKNITFENASLDVKQTGMRQKCEFGLFAGNIDEKATVQNVVVGGSISLGMISKYNAANDNECKINMVVGGSNKVGVAAAATGIKLFAYGEEYSSYDKYTINYLQTHVEANGDVVLVFTNDENEKREKERGTTLEPAEITTWYSTNN